MTNNSTDPMTSDEWWPLRDAVEWLTQRLICNGSRFVLDNWDCKYIDARIDMRTGAVLLRPGNRSTSDVPARSAMEPCNCSAHPEPHYHQPNDIKAI